MRGDAADLRQEREADYRYFNLGGSHYAIGYEMGRLAVMREVPSWRDGCDDQAFSLACIEQVERFHPDLAREVWGYADGQGRPRDEVLPHFSLNLPEGRLSGCTSVAVRTADGHVVVARNYDFLYSQRERYLRRIHPVGYPAHLGTQAGLIGSCYDGVSSRGLYVALHLIHARVAPEVPPGIPYHLIPRILLERCATAREAVDMLRTLPHLFAFNYLVADCDGFYAVEAYPGQVRVREADEDHLVVTNFYAHPDMRGLQGRRKLDSQRERATWIAAQVQALGSVSAPSAWTWATDVLRNHSVPVCHHRPTQATLWAMAANLTSRRVAYCLGAPCRNQFVDHPWPQPERRPL
jgi:hypothetical protein